MTDSVRHATGNLSRTIMKIIIAPQAFKGSLAAAEAAAAMAQGVRAAAPEAEAVVLPMADGGAGTAAAMVAAAGGSFVETDVHGPLGELRKAAWGRLRDGTAVIETAAASGLALVPAPGLRPLAASTRGTGELIMDALDAGPRTIHVDPGSRAPTDRGAEPPPGAE